MDLSRDILIHSGEGDIGTFTRYYGTRTTAALRRRLEVERAGGARWVRLWIAEPETDDGSGNPVYAEYDPERNEWIGRRSIPADQIQTDSLKEHQRKAGSATSARKARKSRANGAKGGRPYAWMLRRKISGIPVSRHATFAAASRANAKWPEPERDPLDVVRYSAAYWQEMHG